MHGLPLVLLFAGQVQTMDLPPGAIVCHDERTATELVAAVETNADKLPWLMNGACIRLPIGFTDQVLVSDGEFPRIIFSNGFWKRDRVVVPVTVARQAHLLQPTESDTGVS